MATVINNSDFPLVLLVEASHVVDDTPGPNLGALPSGLRHAVQPGTRAPVPRR